MIIFLKAFIKKKKADENATLLVRKVNDKVLQLEDSEELGFNTSFSGFLFHFKNYV